MKTPAPTSAYPLTWPPGRQRSEERSRSQFKASVDRARRELQVEIERLGGSRLIISTNVPLRRDGWPREDRATPEDPGVAVYFDLRGRPMVFSCDRWETVRENLWAVVKTIEALRGIERWGSGDAVQAAFTGFAALPAAMVVSRRWYEVLGCDRASTNGVVEEAYKVKMMETHPDRAGNTAAFQEVQQAWEDFNRERA